MVICDRSDVVVGLPEGVAAKLDKEKPGWKISGEYASACSTLVVNLSRSSNHCVAVVLVTDGHKGEKIQLV